MEPSPAEEAGRGSSGRRKRTAGLHDKSEPIRKDSPGGKIIRASRFVGDGIRQKLTQLYTGKGGRFPGGGIIRASRFAGDGFRQRPMYPCMGHCGKSYQRSPAGRYTPRVILQIRYISRRIYPANRNFVPPRRAACKNSA